MLPVVIAWVAYCFFFVQFLFRGLRIWDFVTTVLIISVLFILLVLWTVHRLTEPSRRTVRAAAQRPAAQVPSPAVHTLTFNVAGTTFNNDDGTSRQDILRAIRFQDPPYGGPDDPDADLLETTVDGEPAIEVLLNDTQVGYVPKNQVTRVLDAISTCTCTVDDVQILGGGTTADGTRMNFGCRITISWTA